MLGPLLEPGSAEFDALLERLESEPERADLYILASPQIVRWFLRGVFVREDGSRAHLIGARVNGRELELTFREEIAP